MTTETTLMRRDLEAIRAQLDSRDRLKNPVLFPATVYGYDTSTRYTDVLVDGDDDTIIVGNVTGYALSEGQRVYVEFTPSGGAHVRSVITDGQWMDYDPDVYNVTLGTGGTTYGRWTTVNGIVHFRANFVLGTGSNITSYIGVGLPVNGYVATDDFQPVIAWADDVSANIRRGGVGVILDGSPEQATRFASDGTALGWNGAEPFIWADGDRLFVSGTYEPD
jgi:hypothetical protein